MKKTMFSNKAERRALLAAASFAIFGVVGFLANFQFRTASPIFGETGQRMSLAAFAYSTFGGRGFSVNPLSATALPVFIFYGLLVINTYFSIRCFHTITPENLLPQKIIDAGLAVIYAVLAMQIGNPVLFYFTLASLCSVAALKYQFLKKDSAHRILLGKKISIDILAALFSILVMLWARTRYAEAAIWLSLFIFIFANYIMLVAKPFYVLQNQPQVP